MFEKRVARTYTRAVMNRFLEYLKYATTYKIATDPDGGVNYWVVQHTSRSNKIVWGQHQFKVMADVDAGKYECECKHWEHTCMLYWVIVIYNCLFIISDNKQTHYLFVLL
jgi:hypothetical protein